MGLAARQRVIEKGNEKTEMAKVEEAYIQLVKNK
jgi:hypothetical protein